ncbi:hypothetical protein C1645_859927 [Glomus cerebriforme]|uniref:Uncharacterized protein n=1 Tax=Glomus cerebriforme TaxID=658196 RepID=A0A397SDF5_9GLOM|nr:hypothetical protein C1645_859927 [Glomus cerebriforme]
MKKIETITTHNNSNRKLIGVYEDLGIIINRRREENEIIKDKWDEMEEKFEIDEINKLKEINDRHIQIDNIMEGEELDKLKNKMKEEFIINYYYKDDLKFIIKDSRKMIEIKIIRKNGKIENIKIKINSKDATKNGLIAIILILLMVKKADRCEIIIDMKKCNINQILKKVIYAKERQIWNINNQNYINKIIDLLEDFNIDIQIDELGKQKKKGYKEIENVIEILGEIKVEKWGTKILTKKFNAFWKKKIIDYNIRKVMKNINQLKNKAEWIVQNRNKELRLNFDKDEIDGRKLLILLW